MSDWGRPSNASNPPRRRGFGILAMAIMLVLGAGLGSAGLLYLERANLLQNSAGSMSELSAELDARTQENSELKRQLAKQGGNSGEAIDLRNVLEEQETIIAELREENRLLTDSAEKSSAEPTTSVSEEAVTQLTEKIGQLEASLELAGQVNSEMEDGLKQADQNAAELQARLRLAEQLTSDLQSRLSSAESKISPEAEKTARTDTVVAQLEGKLNLAEQINSELEQKLRLANDSVTEAETRMKLAEQVTAELQDELNRAQQATNETGNQIQPDRKANAEIEQRLSRAEAALVNAQNRLESTKRLKQEADQRLALAEKVNTELQTKVEDVQALVVGSNAENAKLREENARLEKEYSQLLSSREAVTPPIASPDSALPGTTASKAERTPRDPLLVATAMQQAAGLGNLDNNERDRIATRLIEGECVGQILKDELGRVSAITLRDLIRTLESDC